MPSLRKFALAAAAVVVAATFAADTAPNVQAAPAKVQAAKKAPPKPKYTGTVNIRYASPSLNARWNIAAAVKAAPGIGSVKLQKVKADRLFECWGYCVYVTSEADAIYDGNFYPGSPYKVYLLVDRRLPAKYQLIESQVSMSDKVGAKQTAAQRHAALTAAIKASVPR